MISFFREHIIKPWRYGSKWRKIRKIKLKINPTCEVNGCYKKATQVHHNFPVRLFPSKRLSIEDLSSSCKRHHYYFFHGGLSWKHYINDVKIILKTFKIIDGE